MLYWRLLLGTLIIALLVGLSWLDVGAAIPGLWLLPVLIVGVVLATDEVLYFARLAGIRPQNTVVHVGNLLLVLGQWTLLAPWNKTSAESLGRLGVVDWWPVVVLAAATMLVLVAEMIRYEKPGGVLTATAAAVFALVYVGLMMTFSVRLRMQWGVGALVSWIIAVKMGDIGAFTVGRLIGRTKMAPRLSPGKTVEGAVGALVFSCLGAWIALAWLLPLIDYPSAGPIGRWGWLPYGLLMGLSGMMGDLAESLLKRDVGCKDSSTWMPGFGGALDILDSLLLSAPLAWLCWTLGMMRW